MGIYFVGEYDRQLDERGRIILPSKVREKISPTVFVTRSPSEECLHIYTEEEWGVISEKLRELPVVIDKNAAAFVRMFTGRAFACEVDKQGRVLLSKEHIEYAGLNKDVVLVGVNTRLELWDKEKWDEYNNALSENIVIEGIMKYNLTI